MIGGQRIVMGSNSSRKYLWWVVPHELAGMPLPWICHERLADPTAPANRYNDDVKFLTEAGFKSIVAALPLPKQQAIFENCGFQYLSLRIPDGQPPKMEDAAQLFRFYDGCRLPLVVHCEAGIGRTGTLLALLLLHRGCATEEAIEAVQAALPGTLETPRQVAFIRSLGETLD
jgi:atypical dual specificity phosphatase